MYRFLGIAGFMLMGCSNQSGACGQSFCIEQADKSQLKQTYEMEDFKVYQFDQGGRKFSIYEGNAPQVDMKAARVLSDDGNVLRYDLVEEKDKTSVVISIAMGAWPRKIVVWQNCQIGHCDVLSVASRIKISSRGR